MKKFDKEYSTQYTPEKEYLLQNGLFNERYAYVIGQRKEVVELYESVNQFVEE